MKFFNKILFAVTMLFAVISCSEKSWNDGYDIDFPVPEIESVDRTNVEISDTITLTGYFENVKSVTIGNGYAEIMNMSEDFTMMKILITQTCASGKLIVENIYKKRCVYSENIYVDGEVVIVVPDQIVILNFSEKSFVPTWTTCEWVETKDFEEKGWDLNIDEIPAPEGYEHYFSMNDKNLYPPTQPAGQGGNIPYGNYTYDNQGNGFDISLYEDPYVSMLINTGEDIAYLSLVWDDAIYDFQPGDCLGGKMANGEKGHYMKTDNKWIWYSFPLKKMLGDKLQPQVKSAGLFIRNSWDYGADIYPGFQLNIASMVITEGSLPHQQVLFDFEEIAFVENAAVPGWASDVLTSFGLDKSTITSVPQGSHYYSMINHNSERNKNYKFGIKSDNNGEGFDFSKMKHPYLTFAVNTGDYSGFIDFIFYQEASGNKDAEPWSDPSKLSAAIDYPEGEGFYYDTKGLWEWRTYDLVKLLNSVEEWGKQNGAYPDFNSKFDYVTIWPRDGWANDAAIEPFEVNIDYVIVTDGIPNSLPKLNSELSK